MTPKTLPFGARKTARLTSGAAEKRPSTEGLVDNVDPRESQELQELPKYETEPEAHAIPLKEKLITCFWIGLNTFSTLGLIFLSKRYDFLETMHIWGGIADARTECLAMRSSRPAS